MNVLFASSEVVPFSKTGGLADVAGALPGAVAARGHNVMVVTPRYSRLRAQVKETGETVEVSIGDKTESASLAQATLPGGTDGVDVPAIFTGNDDYFNREELYSTPDGDYEDNDIRFAFFAKALLEAARAKKFRPDVIHLNDWQSSLVPVYLKTDMAQDPFFSNARILLTIHNLGYQGLFPEETVERTGLPQYLFDPEYMEFYGKINFLKGGIVLSDAINTVSRRYSWEIQTPEYGAGLDGILRKRSERLFGILNGVDYTAWNPETDKLIAANYSPGKPSGKKRCKKDLLKEFGLPHVPGKPVIGMVSRLAGQKGFDLVKEAIPDMMIRDLQLVILGTGEREYHDYFNSITDQYPDRLGVKLTYDNAIAHKIEAGSDMFLMPSKYEPCGLNQMYSLKYGTVPVVRGTGGLDDTVTEWDGGSQGNGFKFYDYNSRAMLDCLDRALKVYRDKEAWKTIVANGMGEDHSWTASAAEYVKLYRNMLEW